ncbi:MAG: hypothetical protein JO224_07270 [Pelomonas sp.]|nr:hypothetical protein [Roseateles sp.]
MPLQFRPTPAPRTTARHGRRAAAPDAASDTPPQHACGWFESSYELGHGLVVRDRRVDALTLALWPAPPLKH